MWNLTSLRVTRACRKLGRVADLAARDIPRIAATRTVGITIRTRDSLHEERTWQNDRAVAVGERRTVLEVHRSPAGEGEAA
jgi:hypothetical protein